MMKSLGFSVLPVLAAASVSAQLAPGTEVMLRFRQSVNSRTAKAGQIIRMSVARNVTSSGKTYLKAGTPVTALIERVDKRDRFGKNARIRIVINPVNGIRLQPRDKGKAFSGSRTDQAAIASGAGALILGPVGLAGGDFVSGKSVIVKAGDSLRTEVAK